MLSVGKLGDFVGDGKVLNGAFSVLVNDIPVAKVGSIISPHDRNPTHKASMITGLPSVMVEDAPVCRNKDLASCGHFLIALSSVEAGS
jgi:uncharacterized Zn-binding protein involved in type VI secretion